MADNYFERILKLKLRTLILPFQPSDWAQFEQEQLHPFDAIVNKKLASLTQILSTNDWNLFATHFNQAQAPEVSDSPELVEELFVDWNSFEDVRFDDAVASSLMDFDATQTADWDLFAPELDAHDFDTAIASKLATHQSTESPQWAMLQDAQFDSVVAASIHGLSQGYQPADWLAMQALLAPKKDRKVLPFWWRIAAAVALLALTGLGWYQLTRTGAGSQASGTAASHSNKVAHQATPPSRSATQGENGASAALTREHLASATHHQGALAHQAASARRSVAIHRASRFGRNMAAQSATSSFAAATVLDDSSVQQTAASLPSLPVKDLPNLSVAAEQVVKNAVLGMPFAEEFLGFSPIASADIGIKNDEAQVPASRMVKRISVGLFSAFQGSVAELNDKPLRGFASGVRVNVPLKKGWSLLVGALYAERNFEHRYYQKIQNRDAFASENYLAGRIRAIETPVLIRKILAKDDKITLYTQVGITPVLTLHESYSHIDRQATNNASISTTRPIETLYADVQQVSYRPYIGGGQAAAGVDLQVNSSLSLQVEPYFQLGLQKYSEERKPIHTFGIGLGLVYKPFL